MLSLLKTLGALVGVVIIAYAAVVGYYAWHLRTITDVSEYQELLGNWEPTFIQHFPGALPAHAANVRVSYFPGFMQGGAHLQLRVQLPPEEIAGEEERLSQAAVVRFTSGKRPPANAESGAVEDMPLPRFHTGDQGGGMVFPEGYTIYVLSARHGDTYGFPWNHGSTRGIAVSRSRSELVYWAESW